MQLDGNGERRKTAADLHFRHNVLRVVRLERLPLLWIVLRQIARPAPVALRRFARQTKISDEGFAARTLFLVLRETKSLADTVETFGIAEIEPVELRARPLCIWCKYAAAVQTVQLKRRIECVLRDLWIRERVDHIGGNFLPTGKIDDMNLAEVPRICE